MNFLYCLKKKIFLRFTSDLNKIYTQNWKPAREKKKIFPGVFFYLILLKMSVSQVVLWVQYRTNLYLQKSVLDNYLS